MKKFILSENQGLSMSEEITENELELIDTIDERVTSACEAALDALDTYYDHQTAEHHHTMTNSVSKLSTLLLIKHARRSAFAACELAKQNQHQPTIKIDNKLRTVKRWLNKGGLSQTQVQGLRERLEMFPQIRDAITMENIKTWLINSEITQRHAIELTRMLSLEKEGQQAAEIRLTDDNGKYVAML